MQTTAAGALELGESDPVSLLSLSECVIVHLTVLDSSILARRGDDIILSAACIICGA